MRFNQSGSISMLNGGSLKLEDKFNYFGSSVLSTKNDISMWLAKAWTAIGHKSDLSHKTQFFFPSSGHVHTIVWMHHLDAD